MMNEPKTMQEVHEIRIRLHEETKDMPSKEVIAFYSDTVRKVEKEKGIKFRRPEDTRLQRSII